MEKYYDLIVTLIKQNKKYPELENILDDIVQDVCEHAKVVIDSTSNEGVLTSYLEKIVATSMITVPKKLGIKSKRHSKIVLPEITQETAPETKNTYNESEKFEEISVNSQNLSDDKTSVDVSLVDKMINGVPTSTEKEPEPAKEAVSLELNSDELEPGEENDIAELDSEVPETEDNAEINELDFDELEPEEETDIFELDSEVPEAEDNAEINELDSDELEPEEENDIVELDSELPEAEDNAEINELDSDELKPEEKNDIVELDSGEVELESEVLELDDMSQELDSLFPQEATADLELEGVNEGLAEGLTEELSEEENEGIDDTIGELLETGTDTLSMPQDINEEEPQVPDFSCFEFNSDEYKEDIDCDEIIEELNKFDAKHPEKKIIDICRLKFNKNLSVNEISKEINMDKESVMDTINEILLLIGE